MIKYLILFTFFLIISCDHLEKFQEQESISDKDVNDVTDVDEIDTADVDEIDTADFDEIDTADIDEIDINDDDITEKQDIENDDDDDIDIFNDEDIPEDPEVKCNNNCSESENCYYNKCYSSNLFITRWRVPAYLEDTGGAYSDEPIITLPLIENGVYDFTVDWGDGTIEKVTSPANAKHHYKKVPSGGKYYIVTIDGAIEGWSFCPDYACAYDSEKLEEVIQWGNLAFGNTKKQFINCYYLEITATDVPDLTKTTSLSFAFSGCWLHLAKSMKNWDMSNVTDMSGMFASSQFNKDISSWDVSNVTNMSGMFASSQFNEDISSWDVSNVTDMSGMFASSQFNEDISSWDVSNVIDMSQMFADADLFNKDISAWDTSNIINMRRMFYDAKSFNNDLANWNVSNVTNMSQMFYKASAFDRDLSMWNVSNVTIMAQMFHNVTLSTANYDALLIGWSELTLQKYVYFDGGNSKYSSIGATARSKIRQNFLWEITDGGLTE